MKISKISNHIYRLGIWFLIPINVWVVEEEAGPVLVDAGVGFMAKAILRLVNSLGKGPLKRILLTHGHSDHVGAVPNLLRSRKVPVLVHPFEIPYLEGRLPYLRRKKAEVMLNPGIVSPLELGLDGKLLAVGSLVPVFTPGHSPGHVSYYHAEDRILLSGDLFTSKKGRLRVPMPMFTGDMAQAVESAKVLREINPAWLEVCHGGPVENPLEQLEEYLNSSRTAKEIGR